MYAEERQQAIATEVRNHGRVAVAELAVRFDVTGETVRRDLGVLADQGVLVRVHGGAVRPDLGEVVEEPDLGQRERSRAPEKSAIGLAAQAFLPPDGGSALFDAGTTTLRAALAVPPERRLTVVTNAVPLAGHLSTLPNCEVTLVGGRIRGKTQAAVGTETVDVLRRLRVNVAFLGTNGLSRTHGLSTPDADEAATKSAMIAAAEQVVVLADSSKFHREHLVSFGALSDVDVIVTDGGLNPAVRRELQDLDIEVVIA